ncbi:MAG: glycosyltransferase family 4 protein [Longimicrobiales bacterium]
MNGGIRTRDAAVALPEGAARRRAIVLANRLPFPPDDGWKVRTFHIVRNVARRAHVKLLVFHDTGDEESISAARSAFGAAVDLIVVQPPRSYTAANVIRGIVTNRPVHVWNQESPAMHDTLRALLSRNDTDFVLSESTFMERYFHRVPDTVPVLVDTHNIDSITFQRYVRSLKPGPRRAYAALTVRKLARLERDVYHEADAVWVCSEEERTTVRRMVPDCNVRTVPNGVDTSLMMPRPGDRMIPNRALFFGRLDYFPNIDAVEYLARDIVPRLRDRLPDLELILAGPAATKRVVELARDTPGLRHIGRVHDVRALLASAALVLVPLRVGGGTRLKIVEAMAAGRPIVSTSIGAEGLSVRHGTELLIGDSTEAMVESALAILSDRDTATRLGAAARQTAQRLYDWSVIGAMLEASIDDLVVDSRRR